MFDLIQAQLTRREPSEGTSLATSPIPPGFTATWSLLHDGDQFAPRDVGRCGLSAACHSAVDKEIPFLVMEYNVALPILSRGVQRPRGFVRSALESTRPPIVEACDDSFLPVLTGLPGPPSLEGGAELQGRLKSSGGISLQCLADDARELWEQLAVSKPAGDIANIGFGVSLAAAAIGIARSGWRRPSSHHPLMGQHATSQRQTQRRRTH